MAGSNARGGTTGAAGSSARGGTTGMAGSNARGGTTGTAGSNARGGTTGAAGSSAGTTGTAGTSGDADAGAPCTVGAWPAADPSVKGSFATVTENNVGPAAGVGADGGAPPMFTLFRPMDLRQGGLCHPVIT
jgi:hypothetical protein